MVYTAAADGAAAGVVWLGELPFEAVSNKVYLGANRREAAEAGIAAGDHLLHLFTHGVLHLLGYDHIDDQMADEMEALEIALLGQMKIANPYLCDELALGTRETG